jgi:hypothetical protein
MAFKLIVSDTVIVPVKGVISDANGKPVQFAFKLKCSRKKVSELKQADDLKRAADPTERFDHAEFIRGVAVGWEDVQDEGGQPREFSESGLAELMDIGGMAVLAFNSYARENGAREKN